MAKRSVRRKRSGAPPDDALTFAAPVTGLPGGIAPIPPEVSTKEVGVVGTTNWVGDPLVESNNLLRHNSAYGTAGSQTWGEYEKISRTDPDIASVLDFITAPIRDATVDVEAAEDHPDQALAQKQADFVRWCILENMAPRWPDVLDQMARGPLASGFSIHEVVLGLGSHPSLPGGRGYVLRKLAERLPVSVHPTNGWREKVDPLDGSRDLEAIQQIGQLGGTFTATNMLPAWKVLLTTWKRTGNNYRGFPFTRPVWYLAKIREELSKLIGISLVREGAGIPTVEALTDKSPDLKKATRKRLEKFLANLVVHENASMVLPRGWTMKWIFSPGANKGHLMEVYNGLGSLILRQLGAQQLSLGGPGASGARAVGQTHSDTAQGYIQSVVANEESVLNGVGDRPYTGLPKKLIDPNWGPQSHYPRITITLKKSQVSLVDKANAVSLLVAAKAITIGAEDENSLREDVGLSPIDPADRQALLDKAAAAAKAALPQATGPHPLPDVGSLARPLPTAAPLSKASRFAFTPARPLRPAERVLDLAAMDSFLNTARQDFERAVRPEVVAMLTRAAPLIHEAIKSRAPHAMATLHLDTSRLESTVYRFVEAGRAEGQRQVRAELAKGKALQVAKKRAEGDQSMAPVARFAAGDGQAGLEDVDESEVLDNIKAMLLRRLTGRLRGQLETEAIEALRTDGDEADVVSRVLTDQLDTAAFRTDAGSALTKVFNVGRDEAARMLGGVEKVQYSAILDGQQCSACEDMDGEEFDFDSAEHDANLPPNRDCDGGGNCRCILVFIPAKPGEDDDAEE